METMVEATQIIMDDEGRNPLMRIIKASEGRCIAAHFGTYDYTASCGITAKYQTMAHPVCDFAHHMTKVALGGTGIFLSDGATNVMPVAPNRGEKLSKEKLKENADSVHNAWRIGYGHTMHSLINGFYQGWDLNPAQLPMRYAATYNFFLSSYDDAVFRLKTFVERAAISTLTGDIFDDAATGQGLLNFFLKAMNCGAITEEEATATGLTLEEIRSRSFYKILRGKKKEKILKSLKSYLIVKLSLSKYGLRKAQDDKADNTFEIASGYFLKLYLIKKAFSYLFCFTSSSVLPPGGQFSLRYFVNNVSKC